MYTAHFPRLHPSDFRVRTLDGVADDWPIDYDTLEPFFAENDRMMGVSGLAGDPGVSAARSRRCRRCRSARSGARYRAGDEPARLALVAVRHHVATIDYEGRARCINLGHCTPGCAQGAKASTDITYWPRGASAPASSCARAAGCARSPPTSTAWRPASIYYDADGEEQFQPARGRRSSPATASARRGCC